MAFGTNNECYSVLNCIGLPVPHAMPEANGSFTDFMASMALLMYPVTGLGPPPVVEETEGASAQPLIRLRLLHIVRH